jgi:phospholipid-binding lipoprotein MlaA
MRSRFASTIGAVTLLSLLVTISPVRGQTDNSIFDEDPATTTAPAIPDKVEGFNRAMFKFNDGFYRVTFRPLGRVYAKVVPRPIRRGIGSFFHNLAFPTRFVGNLLEGRIGDAGVETGRFLVNTVSSLGFIETADHFAKLQERRSDLGQAFGSWGIGHGTYLVMPVLGPTSVRDGVGTGISGYFLDPVHYLQEWEYRAGARGVAVVNESPELMDSYDQLKAGSIDAYVALRDAYSSRRAKRMAPPADVPADSASVSPSSPK